MNKSFKIARRPGQGAQAAGGAAPGAQASSSKRPRARQPNGDGPAKAAPAAAPQLGGGPTTRKTIEVPEDYFYLVKMRALQRHMKEKEMWAEILKEYFTNHPTL
jgi:hypothetical protein